VKVKVDGTVLQGMGYAERIDMTLVPWRLPIKELLWGRYVSRNYAIVWIQWNGPQPRCLLFFNGKLEQNATLTTSDVSFGSYSIKLPGLLIRKGTIDETLFVGAKKLAALFPKSILALEEEKWYGMATLKKGNIAIDEGNVIHEIVRWP
jgi:hypothetical protein